MSGEFRPRDAVLAGYYFVFLTFNWLSPAFVGPEPAVVICITVGLVSVIFVALMNTDRPPESRFNPFCYGMFLLLTLSVVAADLWIAFVLL